MAHAHSIRSPRSLAFTDPSSAKTQVKTPAKRGFWRRLLDAVAESNRLRAEREITLYLRHSGGKFTDETEREIERRFLSRQI